jgi:threonine/homoserine/homoserine lactone efflux protein
MPPTLFAMLTSGGRVSEIALASSVAAGFGLGIALAGAPGPVQAILLTESVRGGVPRGFRAMAGANLTFAALVVGLALGISVVAPGGRVLRVLELVGGAFLLWLAADAFRSPYELNQAPAGRRGLPSAARGSFAVILNPGVWLFLGTAASSLLSGAAHLGGTWTAVAAAH